ncbi:MAG: hypothetical protein JWL65_5718 [Gammaproteobacteria bacterium]|nr:hypothetical protein [Gammaproteobacteria bacterium]
MSSVSVRYWRGSWVVDITTREGGRRKKRWIKAFGAGTNAKAAAEAYRDEIAPRAKSASFQQRQTATFRDLWTAFEFQLVDPVPGPATIADYKPIGRDYLLPELGDRLLRDMMPRR